MGKEKTFKSYFVVVLFVLLSVFFTKSTLAYEIKKYDDKVENKMVVTPSKLQLNLQSGQLVKKEILVINRLGREETFFIKIEGLVDKKTINNLDEKHLPRSGTDWITSEIESISLKHGERIKFNIDIEVPNDIESGGYYAAVNVSIHNEEKEFKNNQINLVSRIGIPLLISVPGNVYKKGEITQFLTNEWFYLNGPTFFLTDFENLGNIHIMPKGEISVYNFLGAKVAQIKLKESTILPGFTQKWKSTWDKKWLLGKYRAELTMFFGEKESEILKENVTFYAFPLHLFLLLIAIILLVYYITRKIHSKFEIKRKETKNSKS